MIVVLMTHRDYFSTEITRIKTVSLEEMNKHQNA
jgi:hypothetical protein